MHSGRNINYQIMALPQVNGSNIRPWWIHHHYWAMVTTTLVLALPVDSAAVQAFVRKFLWWSCFQARGSAVLASLQINMIVGYSSPCQ